VVERIGEPVRVPNEVKPGDLAVLRVNAVCVDGEMCWAVEVSEEALLVLTVEQAEELVECARDHLLAEVRKRRV